MIFSSSFIGRTTSKCQWLMLNTKTASYRKSVQSIRQISTSAKRQDRDSILAVLGRSSGRWHRSRGCFGTRVVLRFRLHLFILFLHHRHDLVGFTQQRSEHSLSFRNRIVVTVKDPVLSQVVDLRQSELVRVQISDRIRSTVSRNFD